MEVENGRSLTDPRRKASLGLVCCLPGSGSVSGGLRLGYTTCTHSDTLSCSCLHRVSPLLMEVSALCPGYTRMLSSRSAECFSFIQTHQERDVNWHFLRASSQARGSSLAGKGPKGSTLPSLRPLLFDLMLLLAHGPAFSLSSSLP